MGIESCHKHEKKLLLSRAVAGIAHDVWEYLSLSLFGFVLVRQGGWGKLNGMKRSIAEDEFSEEGCFNWHPHLH